MGLILKNNSSPEQYEIYDSRNKLLGIIKFQFGQLDVYPIGLSGKIDFSKSIFTKSVNDDFLGSIPDGIRNEWLEESEKKLNEYYENNTRKS